MCIASKMNLMAIDKYNELTNAIPRCIITTRQLGEHLTEENEMHVSGDLTTDQELAPEDKQVVTPADAV